MSRRRSAWDLEACLAAILLGLATLALFWPATRCDFIDFDDQVYVTANAPVRSGLTWHSIRSAFTEVVSSNWHPLTMLSHTLDCQLYGLNPWGHHFSNVLLHAFNAVLLFVLLRQLTSATWRCFWVAALFAFHPLRVESVAWVAERKDVLSSFFGFLSLIFYVRYAQLQAGEARPPTRGEPALACRSPIRDLGLSAFFLALGLMSKPMLVTWPFVMLLLDYWPLGRLKAGSILRLCSEKAPLFALSVAASIVVFEVQKRTGAMGFEIPFSERVGNALVSYCRYLGKLSWPVDLALPYPHPGQWSAGILLAAGAIVTVISTVLWILRRRYPFLLMGWLWYCGTLVPVIGLIQVGVQAMADRYSYIPSLGVLIALVWGTGELVQRWRVLIWPVTAAGIAGILCCFGATRHQLGYWKDSQSLFGHTVKVTQDNFYAHYVLGNAFLSAGQFDDAIKQYRQSVLVNPRFGAGHNNLGNALRRKGDYQEAASEFQTSIDLDPELADRRFNLGTTLAKLGKLEDAIGQYQETVRLEPNAALFRDTLGTALSLHGDIPAAIVQFREAVRIEPNDSSFHQKLGIALDRQGQVNEAIGEYREALRCQPNNPTTHRLLGLALSGTGSFAEAVLQLQEAVRLKSDDAATHNDLGNAFDSNGSTDQAIRQYQEAIRLEPANAAAHGNLGAAFGKQGNFDNAIAELQEAVRLNAGDPLTRYNLGMALNQKGRPGEAITQLREAVRLQPEFIAARSLLNALETNRSSATF